MAAASQPAGDPPAVLVLASTFPKTSTEQGPRFIQELCDHLAGSDRVRVVVLTQHRPGARTSETWDRVEVRRFRYAPERFELLSEYGGITESLKKRRLLWLVVPFFLLSQVFAIRRLVRKENIRLIHAHWIIPQGLAVFFSKRLFPIRVPHICTGHGADVYAFGKGLARKLKMKALDAADAITVVSNAMGDYLAHEAPELRVPVTTIPMGTDIENAFFPSTRPRTPGQLVFVGRLVEKKGLTHLLSALPELIEFDNRTQLLIAGDGPERSRLEKQAAALGIGDNVRFLGPQNRDEIRGLLQNAEMAVFPFIQSRDGDMEGLGLVTVEAMACKCPVIVGEVPAVHDLVSHESTGLLCDPKIPHALALQVKRLRSDGNLRAQMIDNAFAQVHAEFGWASTIKKFLAVYDSLLDR